jgi:integrase
MAYPKDGLERRAYRSRRGRLAREGRVRRPGRTPTSGPATYATLLLARGTHPTYVRKSLGHASVQLTLDRYSHWMPSMGRNTAKGIDEALG